MVIAGSTIKDVIALHNQIGSVRNVAHLGDLGVGYRIFSDGRAELDRGKQHKHHQNCQDQRNGFSHVSFLPPYLFEQYMGYIKRYKPKVLYEIIIKETMSNSKYFVKEM
jgi:hypothetical protein